MAEIFPETPITSLPEAVTFLGALPMKVGPVPQPLPAERLAAIEARASEATVGPWCTDAWEIYQGSEYEPGVSFWIGETCRGTSTPEQDRADAEFVAHAREDVPALASEVRRQASEIASLNEALSSAAEALRADRDLVSTAEVARWLRKKAREYPTVPESQEDAAEAIARLADKVSRGAIRPSSNAVSRALTPMVALREDVSPQVEKLRSLLAGQRAAVEDPHDSPLHHDYRLGHDLPESGGGGRD